jgi:hypothetical protein
MKGVHLGGLRRSASIAAKYLRELIREPVLIAFALAISPFFLCLDYVGYSREPRPAPRTILFADAVAEAALGPALRAARFGDGRPSLRLKAAPLGAGIDWVDRELRDRRADLAFVSPGHGREGGPFNFATRGDATAAGYLAASSIVATALSSASELRESGAPSIVVVDALVPGPRSDFDSAIPGQIAFCALMMTPLAAFLAGREIRKKGMTRLVASPLKPGEYQAGMQAALLIFCLAAGAITLVLAIAMGFPLPGGSSLASAGALLASTLVLLACSLSSVSIGLAMAPLCSSDSAAINAGFAVTMLQVILSGAFFPMPTPSWLELWGIGLGPLDLLPGSHAVKALGQSLIGGASIGAILPRLALLATLTIIYATAASYSFSRKAFLPRGPK